MATECAHCGQHGIDDSADRCPQCLRATGLVRVAEAPARAAESGRRRSAVILGAVLAAGLAGGMLVYRVVVGRSSGSRGAGRSGEALPPLPASVADGLAFRAVVAQVRNAAQPAARARIVLDVLQARRGTTQPVSDADDAPTARSLDAVFAALPEGRYSSLDLARVALGVLRAAGTEARMAWQSASPRGDEPPEPTGLLGVYVVRVGDSTMDLAGGNVVGPDDLRVRDMDDRATEGALRAQSALAELRTGAAPQRMVALADEAVRAWPTGTVPLAVRAAVFRAVGSSSAGDAADRDLAAALALNDDAALHRLRARLAVASGDGTRAHTEARAVLRTARAWGDAALLAIVLGATDGDAGGDPCAPLREARGDWTQDAWLLCRGDPTGVIRGPAATRLVAGTRDPLRLALAAASGSPSASARVRAAERAEFYAWLRVLGRGDLVPDAGRL